MSSRLTFSVVIASHNERDSLAETIESFSNVLSAEDEIIVVDDGSTDGSVEEVSDRYPSVQVIRSEADPSIMHARNLGVSRASGDAILVSDAHVRVTPDCLDLLSVALEDPAAGLVGPAIGMLGDPQAPYGYGYTWGDAGLSVKWLEKKGELAYEVPILASCFVAARKEVYTCAGGMDEGLTRWGSAEQELSLRLWLMGYTCCVVPSARAEHLFRTKFPYRVEWQGILFNKLRLGESHFSPTARDRVHAELSSHPEYVGALAQLQASDIAERRATLDRERARDFDWFGRRFELSFLM